MIDRAGDRERMVRVQLASRGVRDPLVLDAMGRVPREAFVDAPVRGEAYEDRALPIRCGQTISQPYVVATMVEALQLAPGARVLEIGTGSGYAAAVLAEIAAEVFTVERHAPLAEEAARRLDAHGYARVHVRCGDGTLGWPEHAPYDAILVSAGAPDVPPALLEQLAPEGRLVIPVGPDPTEQVIARIVRLPDGGLRRERLAAVRFVPLVGEEGWRDPLEPGGG